MLSNIFGVMKLEYVSEKPFTLSVGGYEMTLPNGDYIHFDWNCMEGSSIEGTNMIELFLSDFDVEMLNEIQYSSALDLVNQLVSGTITELYMEASDQSLSDMTDKVKVKEFYIEFEEKRYDLLNTEKTIQKLIDIFWADIYNAQVIQETFNFTQLNIWIPEVLQKHMNLIQNSINCGKELSPFYIIEPYGESLEVLNPDYYSQKRSLFYQE